MMSRMPLNPERLLQSLDRLVPMYIVGGDDPLLVV